MGKTTVQEARSRYAEKFSDGKAHGTGAVVPDYIAVQQAAVGAKPVYVSPEAAEASQTAQTLEDELEAAGVTESSHKLSYSVSEWDMADGTKGRSRRISAVPVNEPEKVDDVDPHALLAELREGHQRTPDQKSSGDDTFVISMNDWQYGKRTLQGRTEDTIKIVVEAVSKAQDRINQLENAGYSFGELVVIFGGDIVEGCNNTPQGAWGLEMGQRQQIEGAVQLGLHVLDMLAPRFEKVQVLAVRGNHGENRINGGRPTTPEDNNDTLIASLIAIAALRDERLQHVEFSIADDEAGMWITTNQGWKLGTTHGDVYGKGVSGATIERKVNTWYKNMAAGRDPMGQVDVMITHHYHHSQSADYGTWEWHQTPAQDGALSEYFRQVSGNFSEPGVLSFVMGEERYMEEKVLR